MARPFSKRLHASFGPNSFGFLSKQCIEEPTPHSTCSRWARESKDLRVDGCLSLLGKKKINTSGRSSGHALALRLPAERICEVRRQEHYWAEVHAQLAANGEE